VNGLHTAFTGRLGADPEMKYTPTGKALLNFSVAVDENSTATEGRAAPETTWVRVTAWDEQAEALGEVLRRGSQVYIEGKLTHGKWQGRDGEPRCGLNLSARKVEVLGAIGRRAPSRSTATPVAKEV
jgi:single-strand DNA-binding protein